MSLIASRNLFTLPAVLTVVAFGVCQYCIWFYAPVEQTLGPVQKIFYFHVALAWWGLFSFFIVFVAGIGYLWKRTPVWDYLGVACVEVGVLFSGLTLVSGVIWGHASWNVWWTWDPRLTTTLVMWFVYCAWLLIRATLADTPRQGLVCAVLGIIAFLDVPLVFFSTRLTSSIHPVVFQKTQGGMPTEMLLTLFSALIAFGLLWLCLILYRTRQLDLQKKLEHLLWDSAS